jgi:hypothetical protein
MGRLYGPLNPLGLDGETGAPLRGFPHNVQFYDGNYVLESDALLGKENKNFIHPPHWIHKH